MDTYDGSGGTDLTVETSDLSGDGLVDTVLVDGDGDLVADAVLSDLDGDGLLDYGEFDTDGDGWSDVVMADTGGDGVADVAVVDADSDGYADAVVTAVTPDPVYVVTPAVHHEPAYDPGYVATAAPVAPAYDPIYPDAGTDLYPVAGDLAGFPATGLPVSSGTQAVLDMVNGGMSDAGTLYRDAMDPGSVSADEVAAATERADNAAQNSAMLQGEIHYNTVSNEIHEQELTRTTMEQASTLETDTWIETERVISESS
jgi:hypothetical protein